MEVINHLRTRDIGSSLLRLNRDIKKIDTYVSQISSSNEDLDEKVRYMKNIQKQLTVYKYIVVNLLNLAQKWCVDNGSPVYFFVMNNARNTCSHCNTGQGSETNCGEGYYNEAFDTMNHVDYGFCNSCQSIYSKGDAPDERDLEILETSDKATCNTRNTPTYCNACFTGCESCNSDYILGEDNDTE